MADDGTGGEHPPSRMELLLMVALIMLCCPFFGFAIIAIRYVYGCFCFWASTQRTIVTTIPTFLSFFSSPTIYLL